MSVDLVLQARGKMAEERVYGPEDVIGTEMKKQLPQEQFCEVTRCIQDHFICLEKASISWKIVKLVFWRKPDAEPQKRIRSYRANLLTSVMSKWYATCIVLPLDRGKELEGLKQHVGGTDGINC